MASSTAELIRTAVERLRQEVPALANLKLIFGLELRGRGDIQAYRVEVPGPKITKGFGEDEAFNVSIPRSHSNESSPTADQAWHEAFDLGHIKVEGDPNIQRLIGQVSSAPRRAGG